LQIIKYICYSQFLISDIENDIMQYFALVLIFGCLATTAMANARDASIQKAAAALKGVWINELGSTLNITNIYGRTLQIKGNYRSPSGTLGSQYPLNGVFNVSPMVSGKHNAVVVSFTVHWGDIGSVTAWNGFYSADGSGQIIGQWLLVRPVTNYVWDHIWTGQDRFTKKE
jgi:Avidin family